MKFPGVVYGGFLCIAVHDYDFFLVIFGFKTNFTGAQNESKLCNVFLWTYPKFSPSN